MNESKLNIMQLILNTKEISPNSLQNDQFSSHVTYAILTNMKICMVSQMQTLI